MTYYLLCHTIYRLAGRCAGRWRAVLADRSQVIDFAAGRCQSRNVRYKVRDAVISCGTVIGNLLKSLREGAKNTSGGIIVRVSPLCIPLPGVSLRKRDTGRLSHSRSWGSGLKALPADPQWPSAGGSQGSDQGHAAPCRQLDAQTGLRLGVFHERTRPKRGGRRTAGTGGRGDAGEALHERGASGPRRDCSQPVGARVRAPEVLGSLARNRLGQASGNGHGSRWWPRSSNADHGGA